jgi:hypothetical protein
MELKCGTIYFPSLSLSLRLEVQPDNTYVVVAGIRIVHFFADTNNTSMRFKHFLSESNSIQVPLQTRQVANNQQAQEVKSNLSLTNGESCSGSEKGISECGTQNSFAFQERNFSFFTKLNFYTTELTITGEEA